MQIPRQPLPRLHTNGSWMSHGAPSVVLQRTDSVDSSCTTSTTARVIDGSTRVSAHPADITHAHHRPPYDKLRSASSSPPSPPTADARPEKEERGNHAVKTHLHAFGGTASRTDAALASCEKHLASISRGLDVRPLHSSIASPASVASATPSPPSARHAEIPDASPRVSVTATSRVSQGAVRVAKRHPPPSDNLNVSLRGSPRAQLRPQANVQQKRVEAAVPLNATAPISPFGSDTAAAALCLAMPPEKGAEERQPLYSYRPLLLSSHLASSPSSKPAEAASLTRSGMTAEVLAMPSALSVDAAKVLPNGLRSPSAITDVGAAPLDYSGLSSVEMGLANNLSPTRHCHEQRQQHSASLPEERADNVARSRVGSSSQTNAPFHALQLMALTATDPIASPPLSSRSEKLQHHRHLHQCHGLQADRKLAPGREKRREAGGVESVRRLPARTTKAFTGSRLTSASPAARDCDLQSLIVCPFALVGCCVEGAHRSADLHSGSTLHHHLMAVTKYVQRMQRRQQELEQLVHGLQQQLHAQAVRGNGASEESERARLCPTASPSLPISSPESLPGKRIDLTLTSAGGSKELPRDVSICEPLITDFGMNNEDVDGAGRNTGRGYAGGGSHGSRGGPPHGARRERGASSSVRGGDGNRDGAGAFARQLRMITSAGQQKLDVIYAPSSRYVSSNPLQHGQRAATSAVTETTARKRAAVGVHGRSEKMRCVASPQRGKQEQRQGNTKHEGALSSTLQPHYRHSDGLESVACVSADGQVEGEDDGTATKCVMATSSVPRPFDADCSAESGDSPMRPRRPTGSPLVYYSAYAPQKPGAGGSTEVSGMSNVPPYQIPNESMSPISSASLDLNDHEDDNDAGVMRQQLLNLTPTEIPVAVEADENYLIGDTSQPSAHVVHRTDVQASPGASPRSAPSLVSVTYRPSELARVEGGDAEGTVRFTHGVTATRSASALDVKNRPVQANGVPAPLLVDGLRFAAPLQRPTLVRKSDVVLLPSAKRSTADRNHMVLPPETPPPITFLAPLPSATATSSILSKSDAKQPRRMSVQESDSTRLPLCRINPNASSSPLSLMTPPTVAPTSGGFRVHCNGAHTSCDGILLATSLRQPAAKRSAVSKQHPTHAHSCRIDSDETGKHAGGVTDSVDYQLSLSSKSGRRRNGSQAHRDAALRRPSYATSVLSPQEAAEQGTATQHLDLPPRQEA